MRYRKKAVEIEAVQWTRKNWPEVKKFCPVALYNGGSLVIPTLEGKHLASAGDYIIKGVAGEFYPCKPDIFAQTYDAVRQAPAWVEKERDYREELFQLIRENPSLPVIPMVDSDVVADDGYNTWVGGWGSARITRLWLGEERAYEYEPDDLGGAVEDAINDPACVYPQEELSDEEALAVYEALPWVDCIVVNITTSNL